MKLLRLQCKGGFTKVDDEDYPRLQKHRWYLVRINAIYYVRGERKGGEGFLHRFLLNEARKGYHVHHKNTDGLDNQKDNLQVLPAVQHLKLHHQLLKEGSAP